MSFATGASLFTNFGISTVVLGLGTTAQAHKPDEYITRDQIAACEEFFARVIERCRRPHVAAAPSAHTVVRASARTRNRARPRAAPGVYPTLAGRFIHSSDYALSIVDALRRRASDMLLDL